MAWGFKPICFSSKYTTPLFCQRNNHLSNTLDHSPLHFEMFQTALKLDFNHILNSKSRKKITILYDFCLSFHNIFSSTFKSAHTQVHVHRNTHTAVFDILKIYFM